MDALLLPAFFLLSSLNMEPQSLSTAKWNCNEERWAIPGEVEDGIFRGSLVADCRVTAASGKGIASLERHLSERIRASREIHSGPIDEQYDGLPGVVYDVTAEVKDEKHTFLVRQLVHHATDMRTRLVYATDSKKVEGKGEDADLVKKMDGSIVVVRTAEAGVYAVRLGTLMHIKKPKFAPGGIFKSRAEKAMIEGFRSGRDQAMPEIAGSL